MTKPPEKSAFIKCTKKRLFQHDPSLEGIIQESLKKAQALDIDTVITGPQRLTDVAAELRDLADLITTVMLELYISEARED